MPTPKIVQQDVNSNGNVNMTEAAWPSVRTLDIKSRGHGFKFHSYHLDRVVSWQTLVQPLGRACE